MLVSSWSSHLRLNSLEQEGIDAFPRKMLYKNKDNDGRRTTVSDFEALCRSARLWFGNLSTYSMVFSFHQIELGMYDMIFLDTDKEEVVLRKDELELDDRQLLEYAYEDARKIGKLYKTFNNFTGKGGCGIYIRFPFTHLKYPKYAIRRFIKEIEKRLDIRSLDWRVVGDIQRVCRLPYTVNMKNFRMCFPIDLDWSLDKIIKNSLRCNDRLPVVIPINKDIPSKLRKLDYPPEEKEISFDNVNVDRYMIEVKGLLDMAHNVKDGRHTFLFNGIVPRLVLLGYEDEEILYVCKEFIERTGKKWEDPNYRDYVVNDTLPRTKQRILEGKPLKMSLNSIFLERPSLLKYFKVSQSKMVI